MKVRSAKCVAGRSQRQQHQCTKYQKGSQGTVSRARNRRRKGTKCSGNRRIAGRSVLLFLILINSQKNGASDGDGSEFNSPKGGEETRGKQSAASGIGESHQNFGVLFCHLSKLHLRRKFKSIPCLISYACPSNRSVVSGTSTVSALSHGLSCETLSSYGQNLRVRSQTAPTVPSVRFMMSFMKSHSACLESEIINATRTWKSLAAARRLFLTQVVCSTEVRKSNTVWNSCNKLKKMSRDHVSHVVLLPQLQSSCQEGSFLHILAGSASCDCIHLICRSFASDNRLPRGFLIVTSDTK